jgi:hypothetical protein
VNIFIGINTILGLILADKYMQRKKNAGHSGIGPEATVPNPFIPLLHGYKK